MVISLLPIMLINITQLSKKIDIKTINNLHYCFYYNMFATIVKGSAIIITSIPVIYGTYYYFNKKKIDYNTLINLHFEKEIIEKEPDNETIINEIYQIKKFMEKHKDISFWIINKLNTNTLVSFYLAFINNYNTVNYIINNNIPTIISLYNHYIVYLINDKSHSKYSKEFEIHLIHQKHLDNIADLFGNIFNNDNILASIVINSMNYSPALLDSKLLQSIINLKKNDRLFWFNVFPFIKNTGSLLTYIDISVIRDLLFYSDNDNAVSSFSIHFDHDCYTYLKNMNNSTWKNKILRDIRTGYENKLECHIVEKEFQLIET